MSLQTIILITLPMIVFTAITSKFDVFGHIRSFTVVTGSMEPVIHVGSLVFTYPQQSYTKGEIITFHRNNITVTHRVVDVIKKGNSISYQTKGDANNTSDPDLVPSSKVIGRVENIVPYVGRLSAFIRTAPGFVLFILVPTLFIVLSELWNIKKEIEKNVEKKEE